MWKNYCIVSNIQLTGLGRKLLVRIPTSVASDCTPPLFWSYAGFLRGSSSLFLGPISPAQEFLKSCWGNLTSCLTPLFIFSDPNRLVLRKSFSRHTILREEYQYWRKQVHLNVTLPYDSLVIPRVFSSRLSGLLNTKNAWKSDIFHYLKLIENQLFIC